jgi:hypothetical protein
MTREEWTAMARGMGVANMGGPATGVLAAFPEPTLPRGAAMAHGGHADARPTADPLAELRAGLLAEPLVQARLRGDPALARLAAAGDAGAAELITRLMADTAVLARVHADPRLHRLWSAPGVQDRLRAPAHQHH